MALNPLTHVGDKERIYEITVATLNGAQTVAISAVKFYRGRDKVTDSLGTTVPISGGAAAASPVEVELGGVFPPPSVIRVVATIGA